MGEYVVGGSIDVSDEVTPTQSQFEYRAAFLLRLTEKAPIPEPAVASLLWTGIILLFSKIEYKSQRR